MMCLRSLNLSKTTCWNIRSIPEPGGVAWKEGAAGTFASGHHANIEKWRREQSILRTKERRPDLLEKCELTEKEKKWLEGL